MRRLAVITAILASAALITAPAASADGDPASDVLANASLFNPIDSGISLGSQAGLEAVLKDSEQAGFPIRVALIASQSDLGTATTLWRQPGNYSYYLWYELQDQYDGQVLIVMPNGFGLYGPHSGPHAVTSAEGSVHAIAPASGEQLATAALSAVPLLARAAGHPIPAAELAAAGRAAATAEKSGPGSSFPASAVIALVAGTVLIGVAWTLSLHARPLAIRGRLGS